MKLSLHTHLNLLFIATMLIAGCQQKSSPSPKVAPTLNTDTVVHAQPQTYWPENLSTLKTIPLEKLPELMMGKNVMINTLCLLEKNDPEKPLNHWCITCDTSMGMGIRFLENYPKEPHSLLVIKKDTIVLDKMHFQFDKEQDQPIGDLSYWFSCDQVKQIILNQDTFLTFAASIFMCNGSSCGANYEFLYHINAKQLYVLENFRGMGFFGDINQDMVLDYMELNPKSSEILDTVNLHFYTLDRKKIAFKPLKDKKGNKKAIWLVAVELDKDADNDYRFAKTLKVIRNPSTTN